jgi:hypothetical protein
MFFLPKDNRTAWHIFIHPRRLWLGWAYLNKKVYRPWLIQRCVAGLGLSDQKSTARRDHAHRHRLQNLYKPQENGLLNRLLEKVSFPVFD